MTKLLIDPKTERVLGVGIVGAGAGELIAEGVLAIEMAALASDVAMTIHPHPTLSETMMDSAEVFYGTSHGHLPPEARMTWPLAVRSESCPHSLRRLAAILHLSSLPQTFVCCAVTAGGVLPSPQPVRRRTTTNAPVDPLGRTTPSGSVLGFLQAAQSGRLQHRCAVSADERGAPPGRRRRIRQPTQMPC